MRLFIIAISMIFAACSSLPAKKADTGAAPAATNTATTPAKAGDTQSATKNKKSAAAAADGSTATKCTYNQVKREIKIKQSAEKCTVEYVKDGSAQEIATGTANSSFCTEIADRVKNNLTSAGYTCE